ncbi:hypothetical protein AB7645_41450 [Bradyrhizobium sp. 956_D2_N1_5]|uniref:hypothetical protein n=1 Tax=unclassified Bradyrhizobium TaxID=2631580 RepID=UPI003F28F665
MADQNPVRKKSKTILKRVILIDRECVNRRGQIAGAKQFNRGARFVRHQCGWRWILNAPLKRRATERLVIHPCVGLARIVAMNLLIEPVRFAA